MNPYCYRCPMGKTYPSCELACAKDIEGVIQASTSGAIAGMIAEPIQGVGGFITPPKEYFKLASTSSSSTVETLSPTRSRLAGDVPEKNGSESSTGK